MDKPSPTATIPRTAAQPPAGDHHRDIQGGGARAAVFGASDGLLTNVSLILGVAGAHPSASFVRLAGVAGLLAGAFSMAAGEYISMSAQAELYQRELALEREAIDLHPRSERQELVNLYIGRGVRREVAEELANVIMGDPDLALEIHSREELGISPERTGSPVTAATASFGSFVLGALIPLMPWFFTSGNAGIVASVVLGAVAAVGIGTTLAWFTGRSRVRSALRQLGIAIVAAAVTYLVGHLVGIGTGTA